MSKPFARALAIFEQLAALQQLGVLMPEIPYVSRGKGGKRPPHMCQTNFRRNLRGKTYQPNGARECERRCRQRTHS